MSLLGLPNEILLVIAENLRTTKDTSSLLLTNRRLSSLLTPHLHDLATHEKMGLNALAWATMKGHKELMKLLVLRKGFDIDAPDDLCGLPALHHAMTSRIPFSVRQLLVELGANVYTRTRDGREPIHQAAGIGCQETIQLFLGKGVDINSLDGRGHTVLYRAAVMYSPLMVDFLLRNGADVDMRNRDGRTAIHGAAEGGSLASINILLRNGADTSIRSDAGKTARDYAKRMNFCRVVKLLESASEKGIEVKDSNSLEN